MSNRISIAGNKKMIEKSRGYLRFALAASHLIAFTMPTVTSKTAVNEPNMEKERGMYKYKQFVGRLH
jgi:hypothetical protein